ncbi:MAG: rRNA maturation RNase YbeY [Akkermansiaceae bacterium]|nr:rRNA maturation RNase YbeY [Armatimonadota bacterium]
MDWTLAAPLRSIPATALPDLTQAEAAAETLLAETGYANAEVSLLLTDDPGIHALNKQWRGFDKPTDVLSWPQMDLAPQNLTPPPPLRAGESEVLGDVAVSLDTARRQALARGWAVEEEIALLVVHGILHLLGHEDETEAGAESMRAIERRLLGKPLEKVNG